MFGLMVRDAREGRAPHHEEQAVLTMTALKGRDIDLFLAKPDPARPIILLYGPDAGLVRERADALVASAVDDLQDPFALVRMGGDDLAAAPARLVEEAMTIPLFGGRRAIRVRAGSKSFAAGVETLAGEAIKNRVLRHLPAATRRRPPRSSGARAPQAGRCR